MDPTPAISRDVIVELVRLAQIEEARIIDEYPPNVPNEIGHHAYISGLSFENSFGPSVHDYNFLFKTDYEKLYVWTHTKNEPSALVSDIDLSVHNTDFWKTAGSVINLSLNYNRFFEDIDFENIHEYNFMYNFSPTHCIDDIVFDNESFRNFIDFSRRFEYKLTHISNCATLIDLLLRDDKCFTSLSLLFSSFQLHYCCLICELEITGNSKHKSHELKIWEQADHIPKMESAIVQACRCAESILGSPPNKNKLSRIREHKQKWLELLNINPDDEFKITGESYWGFYLRLFDELRNPSAHSYGNIHFNISRKHTIAAQCFAAEIVYAYVNNHIDNYEIAIDRLKFNKLLLSRVQQNMSTPRTNDN